MKKIFFLTVLFFIALSAFSQKDKYHKAFFEDFNKRHTRNFEFSSTGKNADFTKKVGVHSPKDKDVKILSFKIDPEEKPGAGRGPEIISKYYTYFGTYSARIKIPDVRETQPNTGAVIGYFTYHVDSIPGLSEIDFEWLVADPEIIYVGTWTGQHGDLKRIGRTVNVAKGLIYTTIYRESLSGFIRPLTNGQNQPETVPAIENYDASSQFYTYGFDWLPDRIRWWMIHPVTADTVVLWDYQGSMEGIPQNHSRYRLNFWHTNNWPVETNPNSIEKPAHPYETEIDWMSYKPLKKP